MDEWSLKGKEIRILVEYGDGTDDMYPKRDIQTLRQKLIEDFNKFIEYIMNYPHEIAGTSKRHIEIINKRFGIDEVEEK